MELQRGAFADCTTRAPHDMLASRLKAARRSSNITALHLSLMSSYAHASARPPSDDAASALPSSPGRRLSQAAQVRRRPSFSV